MPWYRQGHRPTVRSAESSWRRLRCPGSAPACPAGPCPGQRPPRRRPAPSLRKGQSCPPAGWGEWGTGACARLKVGARGPPPARDTPNTHPRTHATQPAEQLCTLQQAEAWPVARLTGPLRPQGRARPDLHKGQLLCHACLPRPAGRVVQHGLRDVHRHPGAARHRLGQKDGVPRGAAAAGRQHWRSIT